MMSSSSRSGFSNESGTIFDGTARPLRAVRPGGVRNIGGDGGGEPAAAEVLPRDGVAGGGPARFAIPERCAQCLHITLGSHGLPADAGGHHEEPKGRAQGRDNTETG